MERGKWREVGYPIYWRRHFKIHLLREGGYRTDTTESGGYRRQKRQRPDIGRSSTGEKKLVLTLAGKNGLSPDQQKQILNTLNEGKDNQFQTSETYAVEPISEQRH